MKDNEATQYNNGITQAKQRIKHIYQQIQQEKKKRQLLDQLSISETSSQHLSHNPSQRSIVKSSGRSSDKSDFIYEQFLQIQDYMKKISQQQNTIVQNKKVREPQKSQQQIRIYDEIKRYKQNAYSYFSKHKHSQRHHQHNGYIAEPNNQTYKQLQITQLDLNETKKRNYRILNKQPHNNGYHSTKIEQKPKQAYNNPIYNRIQQKYRKIFQKRQIPIHIQNINPNTTKYDELKIQLGELQTKIIPDYQKRHSLCLRIVRKGQAQYHSMLNKIKKEQRKCNGLKSRIRDVYAYERIISDN